MNAAYGWGDLVEACSIHVRTPDATLEGRRLSEPLKKGSPTNDDRNLLWTVLLVFAPLVGLLAEPRRVDAPEILWRVERATTPVPPDAAIKVINSRPNSEPYAVPCGLEVTMAVAPRQRGAHELAVSDQREALRALVAALGRNAVAAIFGKDAPTIERWLKAGIPLDAEDEQRLRDAFHALSLIEEADDADVARAWFIGMNPELGDDSPAQQLAAGNARAVLAAARSYVNATQ